MWQQQPGVGAFLPAPAPANKSGSTTLLSRINFLVLIVDCSALQLRGRHGHRRSDQVHPGPQGHGQDPLGDRQERGGRRSKEAFQIVELLHSWSRYRSLFSMLTWFSKRFFFIDYIYDFAYPDSTIRFVQKIVIKTSSWVWVHVGCWSGQN